MYVGVVGLGYVGLTLGVALAKKGVRVIGLEVDFHKLEKIRSGIPPFFEQGLESSLKEVLSRNFFAVTNDKSKFKKITHCIITVGTPLKENFFDSTQIEEVISSLGKIVDQSTVFCLRSTVGLGTSRKLKEKLLELGHSGNLAMCPERTLEGFALTELTTLPQIIGAETKESAQKAFELFNKLEIQIIATDNFEVAELAKLVCNAWRDLYFAFSNEIALIGEELSIDARLALSIAEQGYPRFSAAKPGPVGGPCLVKDGISLASSSPMRHGFGSLFDLARRINENVVEWALRKIKLQTQKIPGVPLTIGVIGLAFKSEPPTNDLRNSPSIDFIKAIETAKSDWICFGWDPQILNSNELETYGMKNLETLNSLAELFSKTDVIVIWHFLTPTYRKEIKELIKDFSGQLILDLWSNFSSDEIKDRRYYAFGSK